MGLHKKFHLVFLVAIALAGVALGVGFLAGCTVAPKIVPPPAAPEYSGNEPNGGVIDLGPANRGPAHVDAGWVAEYDELARTYGKDMTPSCRPMDGVTGLPDGTYLVDLEHLSDKNVMATMKRSGISP